MPNETKFLSLTCSFRFSNSQHVTSCHCDIFTIDHTLEREVTMESYILHDSEQTKDPIRMFLCFDVREMFLF